MVEKGNLDKGMRVARVQEQLKAMYPADKESQTGTTLQALWVQFWIRKAWECCIACGFDTSAGKV